MKHSEAKAVKIIISKSSENIQVLLSDNGKGFDVESKNTTLSLGLKTLFERAKIIGAQMKLISDKNIGTTLTLNLKF